MARTDDRRYVRTENAIRTAFIELLSEMPVASVTASAICCKASISRNAFYLHHASVSSLYATLVGELVSDVRAESLASASRCVQTGEDERFSAAIWGALSRHETLLRVLLPSDDGPLVKCLAEGIEGAYVEAALLFGEHGASLEHRLACAFSAWGAVGFVARWIAQTDKPLTEAQEDFEKHQANLATIGSAYLLGV